MAPCEIIVEGHNVLHRQAERAILKVDVRSEAHDQETPSKQVTSAARDLQKLLEPLAPKNDHGQATDDAPVTHFAMSSINTNSWTPRDANNKPLKIMYRASTNFEIKFKDFNKLGVVAKRLSTKEFVQIEDVDWDLTGATKESLAAHNRREAIRDAVRKATDFASALGMPNLMPVEIREGQVYQQTGSHGMPPPKRQNAIFGAGKKDEDALQFVPEDVRLSAKVHAKFTVLESPSIPTSVNV